MTKKSLTLDGYTIEVQIFVSCTSTTAWKTNTGSLQQVYRWHMEMLIGERAPLRLYALQPVSGCDNGLLSDTYAVTATGEITVFET